MSGSSHPCNLNAPGWDPTTEIDNIKGQPQWYSQKDPLPASISPVAKDAFTTAIGDNSDLGQTPHSVILDEYWSLCCKDGGLGALDLDVLYFLPNLPNNPYLSNKSFYYL